MAAVAEVPQRCVLTLVLLSLVSLIATVDFPRAWEIDAAFELRKATESDSGEEDEDSAEGCGLGEEEGGLRGAQAEAFRPRGDALATDQPGHQGDI